MRAQKVYAFVAGTVTGAAPFFLLGFRTTDWSPAAAAMVLASLLCASAWQSPLAVGFGVLGGTAAAAATLALSVGSDWRLLVYVPLGFPLYYAAAAAGLVGRRWYAVRRPHASRS